MLLGLYALIPTLSIGIIMVFVYFPKKLKEDAISCIPFPDFYSIPLITYSLNA